MAADKGFADGEIASGSVAFGGFVGEGIETGAVTGRVRGCNCGCGCIEVDSCVDVSAIIVAMFSSASRIASGGTGGNFRVACA